MRFPCLIPLLLAGAAWLGHPPAATAQSEPNSDPILRVETGMHTAMINRAAVDAAGRLLATASHDKTLRLWSLTNGELLRIIRPPIGEGNEGKLFGTAVSPDGKWVVAAGWTAYQWEKASSIYVFETASGRMVRRIAGLPSAINDVVWSPDGRFVAAGLGAKGVRVYRTSDWSEAGQDADYGDRVNIITFDRANRLATTSDDEYVRLYDSQYRRQAKVRLFDGSDPYAVAFSPDGSRVAVGDYNTIRVDVLAGKDLKSLFVANAQQLSRGGNLGSVAWTTDNALLAGGTSRDAGGRKMVLRWPSGGSGAQQSLVAADSTVTAIVPLRDGGFVYVAADPAFGRYDAHGKRTIDRRANIADLRSQEKFLRASADGSRVAFGFEVFGRRPAWFSVSDRRLTEGPGPSELLAPDTQSLPVADWHDSLAPKLNGKPLSLRSYETAYSLGIAPDRQSFLLGTQWNMRRFQAAGVQSWEHPVPDTAWAINVTRDGRLAVAAFGDGTIRWYRYSDGRELLALFVHKDGKRWVLWTPEGYYDASPGAEDLIGWHVNRGLEHEADYFPASRFRDRFYKPDVVSAVLRTLDIEAALKETGAQPTTRFAAAALPPVLKILSPQEGTSVAASPVQVRYSLRSPSGERVDAIEVKIDGRPLRGDQGVVKLPDRPATAQAEVEGTVAVPLDKDATITLVARAGERTSEAANVRVLWRPATQAPAAGPVPKPKLYVLSVGVSRYKMPDISLRYAAKDASDVTEAWVAQQGGLYSEVVSRMLRNEEATREAVLDGLEWIERQTTARDVALVLLSGHGDNDADGGYYFLPYDVDPDRLRRTAVPDIEIRRSLSHVAGKALFFFDTCHSGSIMSGRKSGRSIDINGFVNDLTSAENGLVVFAASTGKEFAQERDDWKNGAFSRALIEGLSGKADISGDGVITISELEYWLAERVKKLTDGKQHPTTAKPNTIRDFPIAAVVSGGAR